MLGAGSHPLSPSVSFTGCTQVIVSMLYTYACLFVIYDFRWVPCGRWVRDHAMFYFCMLEQLRESSWCVLLD